MSQDSRTWTADDVDRFARDASTSDTVAVLLRLAAAPDDEALQVLKLFLGTRHVGPILDAMPSHAAAHVLVSLDEPGIAILREALTDRADPRIRQKTMLLAALYQASRDLPMPWPKYTPTSRALRSLEITAEARSAAKQALLDVIERSSSCPDLFDIVAKFIQRGYMLSIYDFSRVDGPPTSTGFTRDIVRFMAESSIRLSQSLIRQFETLLAEQRSEETYQRFLAENPVFLDPLGDRVIPKQRLGTEFATDYAVRRLDGRWLLVEIEKPQDPIFTRRYDFTAAFTHAFGQVIDFLHWVDKNVAYAQDQMDGIAAPRGLLVIGIRATLDDRAAEKLRQYNANSARIDVMTFDDLFAAANSLYANLHHRDVQ
jgi:hypothetical protein